VKRAYYEDDDGVPGFYYLRCLRSLTFKHKSLISRYVDNNASVCDICLGETQRAFDPYKKVYSIQKIKVIVENEFR
jgi:hypothetical protein